MRFYLLALIPLILSSSASPAEPLEGFGASTPGGAGGKRFVVINLNDSGPGSLREAVETKGPRIITFSVAGVIHLQRALSIREPFVTIDASTAPAPGVTLIDDSVGIRTHDVILRYLRSHAGDKGRTKPADVHGFSLSEASNVVLDHCSAYWAIDEDIGMWNCHDITVQWCILAEGLFHSKHDKGPHSMGVLMGGEKNDHMSFHHNLMANNNQRNPRIQAGVADVRNNLFYNWGAFGANYTGKTQVNMIANIYVPGPDSSKTHQPIVIAPEVNLYLKDTERRDGSGVRRDWDLVQAGKDAAGQKAVAPFPAPPVATLTVSAVYDAVLESAGATKPVRDAEDERIVRGVKERSGRIIDTPGQSRP